MRGIVSTIIMIVAVFTLGCEKKAELSSVETPSAAKAEVAKDDPFAGFDSLEKTATRLEGAWHLPSKKKGAKVAWEFSQGQAKSFNGAAYIEYRFLLDTPRTMKIEPIVGNKVRPIGKTFAFLGDDLYMGSGSSGMRVGEDIIVYAANGVYTFDGKECRRWEVNVPGKRPEKWVPTECQIAKSGDKEIFAIKGISNLEIRGDILTSPELAENKAEKFESFKAAKDALPRVSLESRVLPQ